MWLLASVASEVCALCSYVHVGLCHTCGCPRFSEEIIPGTVTRKNNTLV